MDEALIEAAVKRAIEKAISSAPDPSAELSRLEMELPALMSSLGPGSEDHAILSIVRRCVAEARSSPHND